jgi:hypothetical protein
MFTTALAAIGLTLATCNPRRARSLRCAHRDRERTARVDTWALGKLVEALRSVLLCPPNDRLRGFWPKPSKICTSV